MRTAVLACLLTALLPISLQGQDYGLAAKFGSLGFGIDGAWAFNERVSVRGGVGFVPGGFFLNDLLPDEVETVEATWELPSPTFTLGVDVRVAGPFRVMGGLLLKSDDVFATGELDEESDIGNGTYGPGGTLSLTLDQSSVMPFAGIGFGDTYSSGFGVYLDLALAFAGGGDIVLDASDDLTSIPGFNEDLAIEAAELNDDLGSLGGFYPIVQFGVRYGLGR
jgi:hypothetical protein